jgi:hypothetical protein
MVLIIKFRKWSSVFWNTKDDVYKTIILAIILYGYDEMRSFTRGKNIKCESAHEII